MKINKLYNGTAAELQQELQQLTVENIKSYPAYKDKWEDFYSMWQRFGPEAARTILIPYIWDGRFPTPDRAKDKNV